MARSWGELLGEADAASETEEEQQGFFGRLRDSLAKSRRALTEQLALAAFDPADDEAWERLEEALIVADVGVPATAELVRRLEARGEAGDLTPALVEEVAAMLGEPGTLAVGDGPSVILVVGVNGTGKTTTIGKLAHALRDHGRSVLLAAADTFRAAAEEQLEIWAERAGADFVGGRRGGDPASVAFDALEAARARGRDVVIVDTAGRLGIDEVLMKQASDIRDAVNPDEVLFVIDAMIGQDAVNTAKAFADGVDFTGVVLSKLDGDARGGAALSVAKVTGRPIMFASTGEKLDDFEVFHPDRMASRILDMGDVLTLI
jgi:signal recognition particle subunit SRP54